MKSLFRLSALLMLFCFTGCSDDEGGSYPASDAPEIKVLRDELYSNPNRKFVIKADLKDDLGLKSLKIMIPEFYLDKEIVFQTDTLVTEYKLAYEFLAPKDTKNEDVYKVNLALEDVSGNVVTKELTLHLDGDFNAPEFSDVSPQDGTIQLLESKMELSRQRPAFPGISHISRYKYLSGILIFYSTLFSDSTILIFFSLKCITIFTNMENPKVMIPL